MSTEGIHNRAHHRASIMAGHIMPETTALVEKTGYGVLKAISSHETAAPILPPSWREITDNKPVRAKCQIFTNESEGEKAGILAHFGLDFLVQESTLEGGIPAIMASKLIDLLEKIQNQYKSQKLLAPEDWKIVDRFCQELKRAALFNSKLEGKSPHEMAEELKKEAIGLNEGSSLVFFGGYIRHAMLYRLTKRGDGNFDLDIANTGGGLEFHSIIKHNKIHGNTIDSYEGVTFDELFGEKLPLVEALCYHAKNAKDASLIYEAALKPIFSKHKKNPDAFERFLQAQRSGTCSYRCLEALLFKFLSDSIPSNLRQARAVFDILKFLIKLETFTSYYESSKNIIDKTSPEAFRARNLLRFNARKILRIASKEKLQNLPTSQIKDTVSTCLKVLYEIEDIEKRLTSGLPGADQNLIVSRSARPLQWPSSSFKNQFKDKASKKDLRPDLIKIFSYDFDWNKPLDCIKKIDDLVAFTNAHQLDKTSVLPIEHLAFSLAIPAKGQTPYPTIPRDQLEKLISSLGALHDKYLSYCFSNKSERNLLFHEQLTVLSLYTSLHALILRADKESPTPLGLDGCILYFPYEEMKNDLFIGIESEADLLRFKAILAYFDHGDGKKGIFNSMEYKDFDKFKRSEEYRFTTQVINRTPFRDELEIKAQKYKHYSAEIELLVSSELECPGNLKLFHNLQRGTYTVQSLYRTCTASVFFFCDRGTGEYHLMAFGSSLDYLEKSFVKSYLLKVYDSNPDLEGKRLVDPDAKGFEKELGQVDFEKELGQVDIEAPMGPPLLFLYLGSRPELALDPKFREYFRLKLFQNRFKKNEKEWHTDQFFIQQAKELAPFVKSAAKALLEGINFHTADPNSTSILGALFFLNIATQIQNYLAYSPLIKKSSQNVIFPVDVKNTLLELLQRKGVGPMESALLHLSLAFNYIARPIEEFKDEEIEELLFHWFTAASLKGTIGSALVTQDDYNYIDKALKNFLFDNKALFAKKIASNPKLLERLIVRMLKPYGLLLPSNGKLSGTFPQYRFEDKDFFKRLLTSHRVDLDLFDGVILYDDKQITLKPLDKSVICQIFFENQKMDFEKVPFSYKHPLYIFNHPKLGLLELNPYSEELKMPRGESKSLSFITCDKKGVLAEGKSFWQGDDGISILENKTGTFIGKIDSKGEIFMIDPANFRLNLMPMPFKVQINDSSFKEYFSPFENADNLLYLVNPKTKEQILLIPRMKSLGGSLLTFLREGDGSFVWGENRSFKIVKKSGKPLGSIEDYLHLKSKEGDEKLLVPLLDPEPESSFISSRTLSKSKDLNFGSVDYLSFSIKDGEIIPDDNEGPGNLFLYNIFLSQGDYLRAFDLLNALSTENTPAHFINLVLFSLNYCNKFKDYSPAALALTFKFLYFLATYNKKPKNQFPNLLGHILSLYDNLLKVQNNVPYDLRLKRSEIDQINSFLTKIGTKKEHLLKTPKEAYYSNSLKEEAFYINSLKEKVGLDTLELSSQLVEVLKRFSINYIENREFKSLQDSKDPFSSLDLATPKDFDAALKGKFIGLCRFMCSTPAKKDVEKVIYYLNNFTPYSLERIMNIKIKILLAILGPSKQTILDILDGTDVDNAARSLVRALKDENELREIKIPVERKQKDFQETRDSLPLSSKTMPSQPTINPTRASDFSFLIKTETAPPKPVVLPLPKALPERYTEATKYAHEVLEKQISERPEEAFHILSSSASTTIEGINKVIEEQGEKLKNLKSKISKLANKLPGNGDPRVIAREIGKEKKAVDLPALYRALLKEKEWGYQQLNPALTAKEIAILHQDLVDYLVLLNETQGLRRLCSLYNKAKQIPKDREGERQQLLMLMKIELDSANLYNVEERLSILLFEVNNNMRLRGDQVEAVEQLLKQTNGKFDNAILERMVGGGKTSVIASIIVLQQMLSDSNRVSAMMVPESLFVAVRGNFIENQAKLGQRVIPLSMRRSDFTPDGLKYLLEELQSVTQSQRLSDADPVKPMFLLEAEMVQSLANEFKYLLLESEMAPTDQRAVKIDRLRKILHIFLFELNVIGDEQHILLNILKVVNFPLGEAVGLKKERIELAEVLFKILTDDKIEVQGKGSLRSYVALEKINRPIIENEDYHKFIKPVMAAAIFDQFFAKRGYLEASFRDAFIYFITHPEIEEGQRPDKLLIDRFETYALGKAAEQEIAHLAGVTKHLINEVLPYVLSKVHGKDFGRTRVGKGGEVIPYKGVDSPATTKFGYVYELLLFHFFTAVAGGVDDKQLMEFIHSKRTEALRTAHYTKETPSITEPGKQLTFLTGVDYDQFSSDSEKGLGKAFLTAKMNLNNNINKRLEIEKMMAEKLVTTYPRSIMHDPHHLSTMLFSFRLMSGTVSRNFFIAFLQNYFDQIGAKGRVFTKLMEKGGKVEAPVTLLDEGTPQEILRKTALNNPKVRGLIDASALFTGYTNLEVAKEILKFYQNDKKIEAVVFFSFAPDQDQPDTPMLLKKGAMNPIILSGTGLNQILAKGVPLDKIFFYYDDRHTTGTDFIQLPDAVNVLTLGEKLTMDLYFQSGLRLRQFFFGQDLAYVMRKDVANHFTANRKISIEDVMKKAITNEVKETAEHFFRSFLMAIKAVPYMDFYTQAITNQEWSLQKLVRHAFKYEKELISEQVDNPWEQHGRGKEKIHPLQLIEKSAVTCKEILGKNHKNVYLIDLIVKEAKKCRGLFDYLLGGHLDLGRQMDQEIAMETALQQDLEQELERELQLYQQQGSGFPKAESFWKNEDIVNFLNDISLDSRFRGEYPTKILSAKALFSLYDKYKRPFQNCYDDRIHFTENFALTREYGQAVFHPEQKRGQQLLIFKKDDRYQLLFLSKKEAEDFRIVYKTLAFNDPEVWLVSPNGSEFIENPKMPFPDHKEDVISLLIMANHFIGQLEYLVSHLDESKTFFNEDRELKLHYLRLMTFKDKYRRGLLNYISEHLPPVEAVVAPAKPTPVRSLEPEEFSDQPRPIPPAPPPSRSVLTNLFRPGESKL